MNAELSLGPFCNWFLPSCLDILWCDGNGDNSNAVMAYGARSAVCLVDVINRKHLAMRDSINPFKSTNIIITSVKFNKKRSNHYLFIGSSTGEAAVMCCRNNEFKYQNVNTAQLELPSKKILSADWSDNSTVYYCIHSVIVCWNIENGSFKQLMIGDNYRNKIAISVIASSNNDQQKLAIGYMNGDITVVSLLNEINSNIEYHLAGHSDDICSLSFGLSNGHYQEGIMASVSRDGFVKVWDIYRRYNIVDFKLDANNQKQKNWFSLAFLPPNKSAKSTNMFEILVGCGSGQLVVIEIPNKPPSSKIRVHRPSLFDSSNNLAHTSVIFSIAVDIKSMLAISTSLDHQIILWDLHNRCALNTFYTFSHGAHDISFSPIESSLVAIAIGDGIQLIKFSDNLNVEYQRRIALFAKGKDGKGSALEWHPERENRLSIGSSIGHMSVLDFNFNRNQAENFNFKYSTNNSVYDTSKIYCLIWGPALNNFTSEEWVVYCLHKTGKLFLHYLSTKKVVNFNECVDNNKKRTDIMWKSGYTHLAIGNEDGTVDVFEFIDKKLNLITEIKAFDKLILCVKWNCNNSDDKNDKTSDWLAICSYDRNIFCYSLNTNSNETLDQTKVTLSGHNDRISSLSWSPFKSNKLASASYDKTVLIWDVLTQTALNKFNGHRGIIYCVQWCIFDEDLVISGGEDNFVHLWRPSKQNNEENINHNESFDWSHDEDHEIISDLLNRCVDAVVSNLRYSQLSNNHISLVDGVSHSVSDIILTNGNDIVSRGNVTIGNAITEKNSYKKQISKPKNNVKTKENKKLSLFPLSNAIEFSSSKYQKLEDIECLYEKMNGNRIIEEKYDRILLYGNTDDIKRFVHKELIHHQKQGNNEQKDILGLMFDIKTAIEQSIKSLRVNPHLISLSMSISRQHWKDCCKIYAKQLIENSDTETNNYKYYNTEMAAMFLLSQNDIKACIDLLLANNLFREALIVAKLRYESDQVIEHIMSYWAKYRQDTGDYEGAAKCLTSIMRFEDAAVILSKRNDQQFQHTSYILRSKSLKI